MQLLNLKYYMGYNNQFIRHYEKQFIHSDFMEA